MKRESKRLQIESEENKEKGGVGGRKRLEQRMATIKLAARKMKRIIEIR